MAEIQELFGLGPVTQCFLCVKEFTHPRVLDCVHTFCLGCLTEYAKKQGRNPGDRFQCPVCLKAHVVPDGGMEDLPRNIFMEHLLEIHHLENADLASVSCQVWLRVYIARTMHVVFSFVTRSYAAKFLLSVVFLGG